MFRQRPVLEVLLGLPSTRGLCCGPVQAILGPEIDLHQFLGRPPLPGRFSLEAPSSNQVLAHHVPHQVLVRVARVAEERAWAPLAAQLAFQGSFVLRFGNFIMALLPEAQRVRPEVSSSQSLVRRQAIALTLSRSEQPRSMLNQPGEQTIGDRDLFIDPFFQAALSVAIWFATCLVAFSVEPFDTGRTLLDGLLARCRSPPPSAVP